MGQSELTNFRIRRYLDNFRRYYPGILDWYSSLEEGISNGQRKIFISWNRSKIQGLAITKNGNKAKLCHISVSEEARDRGIGLSLMNLALCDMIRCGSQEIHVTTSEEVFRNHASFFHAVGFREIDWQVGRYRRGVSELLWNFENESINYFKKRTSYVPHKSDTSQTTFGIFIKSPH